MSKRKNNLLLFYYKGDHNLLDCLLLFVECVNSTRNGHIGLVIKFFVFFVVVNNLIFAFIDH